MTTVIIFRFPLINVPSTKGRFTQLIRGLPLITYAPRGRGGGVKPPIHFYCVLHAKRGGGGPDSM